LITEPTHAENLAGEGRPYGPVTGPVAPDFTSIEFRVIRSGSPARRMKLNTLRCTLGSGEGCTVRLNDATLRPMHAVVLRDAHRVLLRAYSVPIEVNGDLTGETFLHIGDSFVLGSYHFELIDAPDVPSSVVHSPVSATSSLPSAPSKPATRGRLSFSGGSSYVSEAMQLFPAQPMEGMFLQDLPLRANQRAEAEQLRREIDAWQERERTWREQDSRLRDELVDAVSRFHHSQERAQEASDAVAQMRRRMSQLTEELESLSNDSIEFREQAASRQERLRQAADHAAEARQDSLRQRDEALRQRDELFRQHEEAVRDRELMLIAREKAAQERDDLRLESEELSRQLERVATERDATLGERDSIRKERDEIRAERDHIKKERDEIRREREEAIRERDAIATARDEAVAERDEAISLRDQAMVAGHVSSQEASQERDALANTKKQIEQLQRELTQASQQLQDARNEVSHAYAQIQALSAQPNPTAQYKSQLEEFRNEVNRLEQDCAAARDQAATAARDRQLVQSLQDRLSNSEAARNSDRVSWEQEAHALQETIQQLSIELATAASQLSQSQADHDSTRSELDEATERLNVARRELALRPTSEQWDELQNQLAETERQLDETEKQLGSLRRDYDELLGRHVVQRNDENEQARLISPAPVSASIESVVADSESNSDDENSSGDYEWPTYQSPEVAERLQNYTARDEAPRRSLADQFPKQQVDAPQVDAPQVDASQVDAPNADAPNAETLFAESSEPSVWATPSGHLTEWPVENEESPVVGSLAKDLIAKLRAEQAAEDSNEAVSSNGSAAYSSSYESTESRDSELFNSESNDQESSGGSEPMYMLSPHLDEAVAEQLPSEDRISDDESPFACKPAELKPDADGEEEEDEGTRAFDFSEHGKVLLASEPESSFGRLESRKSYESKVEPTAEEEKQPAASPSQADPDDDSIEAYMNRLLQRVQGHGSATPDNSASKPSAIASGTDSSSKISSSTVTKIAVTETVTASKPIEVIDHNTPLVPRSQAPEDSGNMAAMRELANATADSAISQSVRGQAQQLKSKAIMDLMQGGVVLVCAFAFYTCGLRVTSLRYVWYTAAGLAAALSVFFFMDMLKKLSAAKASYERARAQAEQNHSEI
jgi:predicted  nucleic acid-binding Zn-ribbon protein